MSRLTPISWKKFEKFLLYVGCIFKHQTGSHRIYTRPGIIRPLVVPVYGEVPLFVIRNNLRILKIEHKEYLNILKKI